MGAIRVVKKGIQLYFRALKGAIRSPLNPMGYEFMICRHGRGFHRPDGITDKERGCESQFPKPHWETRSGEELAT
jgi:hypothetical protein